MYGAVGLDLQTRVREGIVTHDTAHNAITGGRLNLKSNDNERNRGARRKVKGGFLQGAAGRLVDLKLKEEILAT